MKKINLLLDSNRFNNFLIDGKFIPCLILTQCSILFFEGVVNVKSTFPIEIVQLAIDVIFMVEIATRIRAENLKCFFLKSGNVFDFLLVLLSFTILIIPSISVSTLTALRVIRLIRVVKFFTLIPNFEKITQGVLRAIKASRVVLLMLFLLLAFFSMLGYILFKETLPQYFSDPLMSTYTVFSLFTVEGWNEIPTSVPLGTVDYYLVRCYVILVIVFGSFLALSLANAIFIDEMVIDNNDDIHSSIKILIEKLERQERLIRKMGDEIQSINKSK